MRDPRRDLSCVILRVSVIMTEYSFVLLCVCACAGVCVGLVQGEGAACISDGGNGKCIASSKCASAATSQAFLSAGYGVIEKLPEPCSTNDNSSLVCCTDCDNTQQQLPPVDPSGQLQLLEKKGPKALDKCKEYFHRLPYQCRKTSNVQISKTLEEQKKCHKFAVTLATPSVHRLSADTKDTYTHMALLGYGKDAASAEWLCSGGVISERFILTAGHCKSSRELGTVSFVRLGNQKRSEPASSWHLYKIKRVIAHPDYKPPAKYNDIALLETENEITFSSDVLPMCLNVGQLEGKDLAKVFGTGWGTNGFGGELSDSLKVIELSEQPESACVSAYPISRHLRNGYDHTSMMCYQAQDGGLCQGDGGGPVQTATFQCAYTAVGVTSFGRACGNGTVDVYSRVSHYVPWIESLVWP